MNMIFGLGVTALSWAFPQLQAPIRAYQWGQTAYTVCSVAGGFFTGGVSSIIDGIYALATSSRAQCEAARQLCLMNAGSDYWKQRVCEQVYERCIASLT